MSKLRSRCPATRMSSTPSSAPMSERGRNPGSGQGSAPAGSGHGTGGASDPIPAQARRPPSAGTGSAGTGPGGSGPASAEQPPAVSPATQTEAAQSAAANEQRIAELEDLRLRALADLDNMRKKCAS